MGLSISSNRPNVKFTVTNGGRTPAWSFDPQIWILLGDTPQTADQRWHMGESNLVYAHRFFAVGQRYDFTFWDKEAHISQETREAIKRGETRLFVAGTLHYKDMRGHKRSQNFTAIWDAANGSMKDWEV